MKYAKKRDGNHNEIVRYLRQHGVHVTEFGEGTVPDTLLCYKGRNGWGEIKVGKGSKFTDTQLAYISETPMEVAFLTTPEQALEYAKNGTGALSSQQKIAIAGLLFRNAGKRQFTLSQVSDAIGERE